MAASGDHRRRLARRRFLRLPAVVAVVVTNAALLLVLGGGSAVASPTLQSTGSSFAGIAIQEWAGQASTLYGLNINWQVSSSVNGLDEFAQNLVDFGASDIPYSSGQATSSPTIPYEYLPDVAGALSFMYNLTGTTGNQITNLVLDAHVIEEIFTGTITKWNDQDIENLNPQLQGDLPATTILPIYRTDASGENYLLSDYLLHLDPTDFTAYQTEMTGNPETPGQPSAVWPIPNPQASPSQQCLTPGWCANNLQGVQGSDTLANVVSAASSNGAIGYVETAYAKEHNEPVASLQNASGNDVQPTSVNDATALEDAILHADLTQDLTNVYTSKLANAYPLSAYSYLVTPCQPTLGAAQSPPTACAGNNSDTTYSGFPADKGQALGQFVAFLACAGQQKMAVLGYSPLPPNLVQEDFDAVGRLNGGQQPPPPTAATCKNPYVDGQVPLPGEPAVVGQAPGVPGSGGAPAVATLPGNSAGATAQGAASSANGTVAAAAGSAAVAASSSAAAGSTATSHTAAASTGPNQYLRADALTAAATSLLDGLSPAVRMVLWCGVLLVVLGAPALMSWGWRRRRRQPMGTVTPMGTREG